ALADVLAVSGCLILPSLFEPWGVVIAEACAAGLPIICTDACGAAFDLVRPDLNGQIVKAGDAESLARALHWIEQNEPRLPEMAAQSQALAKPFSAQSWADQWNRMLKECCHA